MPANTLAQQANPRHGNDRLSVIVYSVSNIVDNKVIVRARCYRSMRKNEEPHKLEVIHGLPVGFYSRLLPGESLLFQTLTAYEGDVKIVPLKPSGNSTRFQPRASLYVVRSSEVPAAHKGTPAPNHKVYPFISPYRTHPFFLLLAVSRKAMETEIRLLLF